MKQRIWLMLLVILTLLMPQTGMSVQAAPDITIYLDGEPLESDVAPYIIPELGVTMVPLRIISEGLGADVTWSQATQTAMIAQAETTIAMTVNQQHALVNGNVVSLDASVQNKNDRVMVPLRFVSEQLGLQVDWFQDTRSISLTSEEVGSPTPIVQPEPATPPAVAQPQPPARGGQELRGAWISTVYNLDWPSPASYGKPEQQRQEYIQLLDELQQMGLNTVFVQVRPTADALYRSTSVPWSKFLTGTQGKDPGYDPLAFMIAETHKRGMEFHAWFNPFRAHLNANTSELASNHIAVQRPEWIVKGKSQLYINPGIPEARQRIIAEIMEVVEQYEIDGVHLDDYFYPSDGVFPDDQTFQTFNSKGFATKADWRRDNINEFVKQLGQAIRAVKPDVSFGISPFGVWRNQEVDSTGSATKAGVTAYDHMHADVRTWIRQGWIDYVMPQIYWSLSFAPARYDTLVDWWVNEVRGTGVTLYIGHAPYKLGTAEAGWQSADEIIRQLEYNKQYPEVAGDVFFSAKDLRRNPLGIVEALRQYYQP